MALSSASSPHPAEYLSGRKVVARDRILSPGGREERREGLNPQQAGFDLRHGHCNKSQAIAPFSIGDFY